MSPVLSLKAATRLGHAYFVLNGEMYLAKLKEEFESMDVNGDGFVTREELMQGAKDIDYALTDEEVEQTMKEVDLNKDEKNSLDEFIAAAVSRGDLLLFCNLGCSLGQHSRILCSGQGPGTKPQVLCSNYLSSYFDSESCTFSQK